MTEHLAVSLKTPPRFNFNLFGLDMDRQHLYRRIDQRVDVMIRRGLVQEVRQLLQAGYHKELTAMQALGYKEMIRYLEAEYSLEEATEVLKRDTRHYAKRQLTWFRRYQDLIWVLVDTSGNIEKNIEIFDKHLAYGQII